MAAVHEEKLKIGFSDGYHGGHFGYHIEMILAVFDLLIGQKLHKIDQTVSEDMSMMTDAGHQMTHLHQ